VVQPASHVHAIHGNSEPYFIGERVFCLAVLAYRLGDAKRERELKRCQQGTVDCRDSKQQYKGFIKKKTQKIKAGGPSEGNIFQKARKFSKQRWKASLGEIIQKFWSVWFLEKAIIVGWLKNDSKGCHLLFCFSWANVFSKV